MALGLVAVAAGLGFTDERRMPDLDGAVAWLNSAPIAAQSLRGKVVLVDFWTYSCINSLRELPYVQAWAAKYKDAGLVVIGVHTPEFAFEKERANVEWALEFYRVTHPVPMDNNYAIWNAFTNNYWPADYFIDGKGTIRHHHFGEGDYAGSERMIQELLKENGAKNVPGGIVSASGTGPELPASDADETPETYVGTRHGEHFATANPSVNEGSLSGTWDRTPESATLQSAPGAIVFRFHARDLHLVMGGSGKPIRFKVTLDGAAPGDGHGVDVAPDGTGEIREPRMYQLIRQKGGIKDRTFRIEFLDPGATAYSFTFG
jgi:thiol-disulfide isomerase/thioredoxin